MTFNRRLNDLERKIQPEMVYIPLMAYEEIPGKAWGENFTDAELAEVKQKHILQHPGKECVFVTFEFTDDWRSNDIQ